MKKKKRKLVLKEIVFQFVSKFQGSLFFQQLTILDAFIVEDRNFSYRRKFLVVGTFFILKDLNEKYMDRKNHTPSGNKEVYSDKHQTSVYVKANRKNLAFSLQIRKKKDGINLGQIIFYREIIYI